MSDGQYIESTTPGKFWNLYTYKPQGQPPYAMAVEGEYKPAGDGCDFASFSYVMFQARTVRENIVGRFTVKARNAALDRLFIRMRNDNLIPETASLREVF